VCLNSEIGVSLGRASATPGAPLVPCENADSNCLRCGFGEIDFDHHVLTESFQRFSQNFEAESDRA
jgi:hypothetical protein